MNFSSLARTRRALGPGRAVWIFGPMVMVLVVMAGSPDLLVGDVCGGRWAQADVFKRRSKGSEPRVASFEQSQNIKGERELVAAEEIGADVRGQNRKVPARTGTSFDPAHARDGAFQQHKESIKIIACLRRRRNPQNVTEECGGGDRMVLERLAFVLMQLGNGARNGSRS